MWAYPSSEGHSQAEARRRLAEQLPALGWRLDGAAPSGRAAHTVVNRRLMIAVYPAVRKSQFATPDSHIPRARWFRPEDFARAAIPTLTRKIAIAAGFLRH